MENINMNIGLDKQLPRAFRKSVSVVSVAVALGSVIVLASLPGAAQSKSNGSNGLKVSAAEFDPQHDCDAQAAWVKNIGLTAADDSFAYGFLMHKLCSTDTNAASFGLISGANGQTLIGPNVLGFHYKNSNAGCDAHCGAGAPRFNVSMSDGSFHFIGGGGKGTTEPRPPRPGRGDT